MKNKLQLAKELALPPDVVTQKINVLGQSGGGKTYLAMKLAELMLEQLAQIVVIDLVGVWWGLLSSADGLRVGFPILVIGGERGQLPLTASSGPIVADMVVDQGVSVVCDVSSLLEDEAVAFVTAFIDRLFHRKKTNKTPMHLFLEEAQELAPESPSSKGEVHLRRVLTRLCKIGRNYGIGYTVITQEPQAASKRVLNQAGTIIAVRTIGKHEREIISATARSRATSKEQLNLVDVLPELQTGEAIVWSPAWLKFAGKVHVLPKVTFDSSKTPEVGERPREPKVLAPVEIEKYRAAMAAAVAEAEAQDPSALQRKVRQLEAALAARPPPAPPERELVHIIGSATADLFKKHMEESQRLQQRLTDLFQRYPTDAGEAQRLPPRRSPGEVEALRSKYQVNRSPLRHPPAAAPPASDGEKLGAGPLKMLEAIASKYPAPVARKQLAALSGFSIKGGSFRTYLPRLRTLGLVDYQGDSVVLTEAGVARAGAAIGAGPRTTEELLAQWNAKLGAGPRRMLAELVAVYPDAITRAELAERTGFELGGGSFRTYLPRLRTLGLADYLGDGVRASDTLFPR